MVNLYSSYRYFNGIDGISVVDTYFNQNVRDVGMFNEFELKLLKEIEHAEPVGNSGDILHGRFGNFLLKNISSGVKTVLLLSLIARGKLGRPKYIDITECGSNVLTYVFKYADKLGIPCILQHICFDAVRDFDYILDEIYVVKTTEELIDLLVERLGGAGD